MRWAQPVQVYLDPARLYAFDRGGTLEVAPLRAVGPGLRGGDGQDRLRGRRARLRRRTRQGRKTTR